MNREQALNYLKSSGFSDEQIREIEEGLRPKRIKCEGVNDLREKILVKSLNPDIKWMRQAIDQLITDVFSAACNEDFLYEDNSPDKVYRYCFQKIDEGLDLIEEDMYQLKNALIRALDKEGADKMIDIHLRNLSRYVKNINVIVKSGLEVINDEER